MKATLKKEYLEYRNIATIFTIMNAICALTTLISLLGYIAVVDLKTWYAPGWILKTGVIAFILFLALLPITKQAIRFERETKEAYEDYEDD